MSKQTKLKDPQQISFSGKLLNTRGATIPANIDLDEDILKTSSRCLNQNEYIHFTHTSSKDVFKTSWSRPIYSLWSYVFKTSSRCLQDLFKTSSRRLQGVLQKCLQEILKMSSRHFQDVSKKDVFMTSSRRLQDDLKTSSRHLQEVLQRCLQDVLSS